MEERHFGPIWFIPGGNRGRYPFCHSLYIEGPGILIDPASDRERLSQLRQNPGIRMVWLSHAHEDHFMHLDLLDDLPVFASEPEALPLSDLEVFLDWGGIEDQEYREHWRRVLREEFHFKPRRLEKGLVDGQIIDLGAQKVEVISTPGHTPGHLAFFFREAGILFVGDYDLSRFGPWYGDVHSSIEGTIESVKRLKEIPASVWIASHEKGIFTGEPGKLWDDYLNVIAERERKLLNLLEKPRTMREIVEAWVVYGRPREPKAFFEFGERALTKKHLEHLMRSGRVVQENDRFVRTD